MIDLDSLHQKAREHRKQQWKAEMASANNQTQENDMSKDVSKSDLIDYIAKRNGVTKTVAKEIVGDVFDYIQSETATGKVRIHGFGIFSTRTRKGRVGRNPRTGEAVNIAASTKLHFTASKSK